MCICSIIYCLIVGGVVGWLIQGVFVKCNVATLDSFFLYIKDSVAKLDLGGRVLGLGLGLRLELGHGHVLKRLIRNRPKIFGISLTQSKLVNLGATRSNSTPTQ